MSHRVPARLVVTMVLCVGSLAGCRGDGDPSVAPSPDPTGPYVSVAVDNHFHDIHAESNIEISSDRPFVIKNEGRNLHNVTIVGTDISEDVKPGDEVSFDPVGDFLDAGTYDLLCRYHDDAGMSGRFTVTD